MIRLLDRHILKELIGPFLFGVAAFTSIMFAGKELFKLTELLAEYGAPVSTAAKLVVLHLPSLVVLTLPMSMLLAALLGFGRLSGDSEIVALFAGGISLYRVALPVILMAILVTVASFVLSEVVAPRTNLEHTRLMAELKGEEMAISRPISWSEADNGVTKGVYHIGGFDSSNGMLRDVVVIQYKDNKPARLVYGREAFHEDETKWSFKDGFWQNLGSDKGNVTLFFSGSKTKETRINKTPDQLALYQKKHDELSFSELREFIAMLQAEGADVNEYRVRLYQKISLPLASLVFALIGTPLGLRPHRSSSAMGLGLSIVIIFGYWVIMHYMTILGSNGSVSPAAAGFIPTLAGAATGVWLLSRAAK